MNNDRIRRLLNRLRRGDVTVKAALEQLQTLPFEDIGDARIDHHRSLRRGAPEIIYGQGKSADQIIRIAEKMAAAGTPVVASRLSDQVMDTLEEQVPKVRLHRNAHLALFGTRRRLRATGAVICCAGTTDLPVAEEAALVMEALGHKVTRLTDVGVAGLHRLLAEHEQLRQARLVIAVAGMEGALPSVVAGLVAAPVIGVPTSVGYGTSFGGVSALLAMLNSCAGGLLVVNIDNGVGAALAADAILRAGRKS